MAGKYNDSCHLARMASLELHTVSLAVDSM